jgi:MoaA/NifB/PqqE/SkfB family radical SAM enzyme
MDRIPARHIDAEYLLTQSSTFCALPWTHLHRTPDGTQLPCCIASLKYKNAIPKELCVEDAINSDFMKQLRLDMLLERRAGMCKVCYKTEQSGRSFRQESNLLFGKHIVDAVENTSADGTLHNFKMRYFDIRFNNVCNFKCRTCNSGYSSLWEAEDLKQGIIGERVSNGYDPGLLEEVITHIPYMDRAYFAGGEPLVSDEHYFILNKMIELGRTDIKLIYNSNASILKYKSHNLLKLWNKFSEPVEFFASIDHYGDRAEYIRHGTKWDAVEKNLAALKKSNAVKCSYTSTVSMLNYSTFAEFIEYMINQDLLPEGDWQMNPVWTPQYLSPQGLPTQVKKAATKKILNVIRDLEHTRINEKNIQCSDNTITSMKNMVDMVNLQNTWMTIRSNFVQETQRLDAVRKEKFSDVFPEMQGLIR